MLASAYANVDDRPKWDLESFKVNKGCDIKTYCGVVSLANMSVSVSFETSTVSFEVISSSALLSFAISTNPLTFELMFSTLTELTGKNLPKVKVAVSASLFPEALRCSLLESERESSLCGLGSTTNKNKESINQKNMNIF